MSKLRITIFVFLLSTSLLIINCDSETITEPSFFTVSGYVTRADNGGGIPKVDVTIGERSFRTGSTGYYEIERIRPGECVIRANKDCCYEPAVDTIVISGNLEHDFQLMPKFSGQ